MRQSLPRRLAWPPVRFLPDALLRLVLALGVLALLPGCYAPIHSAGTPATLLPDEFRMPMRTAGPPLNYASLTRPPAGEYLLGPDDVLEVTVPDLYAGAPMEPMRVRIMPDGQISLPLVGGVNVSGVNVNQAQAIIAERYAEGYLVKPRVIVFLAEKATVRVLVFGNVRNPGVYELLKYENDVGHALAAAGGLTEEAAEVIELHRRVPGDQLPEPLVSRPTQGVELLPAAGPSNRGPGGPSTDPMRPNQSSLHRLPPTAQLCNAILPEVEPWHQLPAADAALPTTEPPLAASQAYGGPELDPKQVMRFPLRGLPSEAVAAGDITLQSGDAVVVPSRRHEVFYVVGKLNPINMVRFTASERDRELGAGFVLPRDREIDVVTAVAMAGYIDPIDSPTTVTVHRTMPDGCPMLIRVDLIKARYNPKETVLICPGDIVYLNPDGWWWFRRTFDRVLPELITLPYRVAWGLNGVN